MREVGKLWSNSSEGHSSDPEEDDEEGMAFGEAEEDSEEMMDLSDLPTALFACSVHEAVFEEDRQRQTLVFQKRACPKIMEVL
ncbi:calcipressin-3-like [Sinocyclocheilus grahami]|uniref:calcipressin-3-like n=1 Tax=Sinocyclocheilus grahami TaxID=75366 RepID=UPI0007AC8866|nr:PREDICTED: calcipressin-3-like [Sinocyclocheilus grahami]